MKKDHMHLGHSLKNMPSKVKQFSNCNNLGNWKPIREWLYVEDGAMSLLKAIDLDEGIIFLILVLKKVFLSLI